MSYLDDPNHEWVLEPGAMDDPEAVLCDLVTRLSAAAEHRFTCPEDFTDARTDHQQPHYDRLLHALLVPPDGISVLDAFDTMLATLALPRLPEDRAEERDLILRGAQGLYVRGAGTPAQCIDTSMVWYYG